MTAPLLHAALLWLAGCGGSNSPTSADSGAVSQHTNTDPGAAGDASQSAGDSGTSTDGVPAECKRSLSESGCPATYDDASASIECSSTSIPQVNLSQCGGLRLFLTTDIDVATTCSYDASGALLGSRECSKPIGHCNCFYAGEAISESCADAPETNPCTLDAGT